MNWVRLYLTNHPAEREPRRRCRDPTYNGSGNVQNGPPRFASVDFQDNLHRKRREGRKAAQEPHRPAPLANPAKTTLSGQQPQQKRSTSTTKGST